MEITVRIPDEIAAEAQERGMAPEQYVEEILAQELFQRTKAKIAPRTPESVRAWLDQLAEFSDKIPPLPDVITRDWIYNNHD